MSDHASLHESGAELLWRQQGQPTDSVYAAFGVVPPLVSELDMGAVDTSAEVARRLGPAVAHDLLLRMMTDTSALDPSRIVASRSPVPLSAESAPYSMADEARALIAGMLVLAVYESAVWDKLGGYPGADSFDEHVEIRRDRRPFQKSEDISLALNQRLRSQENEAEFEDFIRIWVRALRYTSRWGRTRQAPPGAGFDLWSNRGNDDAWQVVSIGILQNHTLLAGQSARKNRLVGESSLQALFDAKTHDLKLRYHKREAQDGGKLGPERNGSYCLPAGEDQHLNRIALKKAAMQVAALRKSVPAGGKGTHWLIDQLTV